jgi:hypothetical protein
MINKVKLPEGWRADCNAVPLPLSRPWSEAKTSGRTLDEIIEGVGLECVLEMLESTCKEQSSLFKTGCREVFPLDPARSSIWGGIAANLKRHREVLREELTGLSPEKHYE